MAPTESAKAASFDADVGKIDVAVDDIGDHVADSLRPQKICGGNHGQKIGAFGFEEMRSLVDGDILTAQRAIQYVRRAFGGARKQSLERNLQVGKTHGATVTFQAGKLK